MLPMIRSLILSIPLAILPLNLCFAAKNVSDDSDPFIKKWQFFDGISTYYLNIQKSNAPGQAYSIDYTFMGGSGASDYCNPTSNISFTCASGETVTRNDSQYAVTLQDSGVTTSYYDPDHMPPVSPLFGNWKYHFDNGYYKADYTITIMKGDNDNQLQVQTSSSNDQGGSCGMSGISDTYYLTKNADGTMTATAGRDSFKYDPINNQIINPNLPAPLGGGTWLVGFCIQLDFTNQASPIFTKA